MEKTYRKWGRNISGFLQFYNLTLLKLIFYKRFFDKICMGHIFVELNICQSCLNYKVLVFSHIVSYVIVGTNTAFIEFFYSYDNLFLLPLPK